MRGKQRQEARMFRRFTAHLHRPNPRPASVYGMPLTPKPPKS